MNEKKRDDACFSANLCPTNNTIEFLVVVLHGEHNTNKLLK